MGELEGSGLGRQQLDSRVGILLACERRLRAEADDRPQSHNPDLQSQISNA